MISRFFLFLLGLSLMVIGFTFMIIYLNLLSFGYSIGEYLVYIMTRIECIIVIVGLIMVILSLFRKEKKHVKRIRHNFKFIR